MFGKGELLLFPLKSKQFDWKGVCRLILVSKIVISPDLSGPQGVCKAEKPMQFVLARQAMGF
jgi:hypothetical protein